MKKNRNLSNKFASFLARTRMKMVGLTTTVMIAMPQMAMAGDPPPKNPFNNESAESAVQDILGKVIDVFPLVGIFFIAAGGFKLIMAYRSDQPEGQSAAAKDIAIGAVFIAFRAMIWPAITNIFNNM